MEPNKPKGRAVFPLGFGFITWSGLSTDEVGITHQFIISKNKSGEISVYGPYSEFNQKIIDNHIDQLFENGEQPEVFFADTDDPQKALNIWKLTSNLQ
jgi:hypothetical protein